MRVLVFGDSITQGFWDMEGGWVARLRRQYDQVQIAGSGQYDTPTVFNLGVSGDSSDDVSARLATETEARNRYGELAFVIAVGVNDARTEAGREFSSPERYRQNLEAILRQAERYSRRILFVGLTPCVESRTNPVSWGDTGYTNPRIKEFDQILRQFCAKHDVPFVEVFEPFSDEQQKTELLPDGLHPNEAGHQLIYEVVRPALDGLLYGQKAA